MSTPPSSPSEPDEAAPGPSRESLPKEWNTASDGPGLFDAALDLGEALTVWEALPVEELTGAVKGYRLSSLIARGGMGAVYQAMEEGTGEEVAVKVLPPRLSADPEFAARFRREIASLRSLHHPHIVQVREAGRTDDGLLYYVMELIAGPDLARHLRQTKFGLNESMVVLRQVCDAIRYAHAHGVLHRDLKPSNILISATQGAKVVDFGLAVAEGGGDTSRLTATGVVVGTLEYASPEQLRGEPVTPAADVYSLGVLAYEMFTGEIPRGAFDPPSQRRRSIDPGFDAAILRALQPDLTLRTPTVDEFIKELTAAHETALLTGSMELIGTAHADILNEFYQEAMSAVPPTVRVFVEDKLLTPSGYRDSRSLDEALAHAGVTQQALETLIDRRLLRIEQRGGVPRVEISHDRLAGAIQASRDRRNALEAEKRAHERELALRHQFRIRVASIIAVGLLLIGTIAALHQYRELRLQREAEAQARQHLTALTSLTMGPMADEAEALGRLAIFDPIDRAAETLWINYLPSHSDEGFRTAQAQYWQGKGQRLARRGKREEAVKAFQTASSQWQTLNRPSAAILATVYSIEQRLEQGLAAAAEKAISQARQGLLSLSNRSETKHWSAILDSLQGRLSLLRNKKKEAIQELTVAHSAMESIMSETSLPKDKKTELRAFLIDSTGALIDLQRSLLDDAGAKATALRRHEWIKQQQAEEPNDFRHSLTMARSLDILGRIAEAQNDSAAAQSWFNQYDTLSQELNARDPANVEWRGLHAWSLGHKGVVLLSANRPQEAIQPFTEATAIHRQIASIDPSSERWQWDLAGVLLQLSYAHSEPGDWAGAEPPAREALEAMIPFATSPDSSSANRLFGLSAALPQLGDSLKNQNRLEEATAHYQFWSDRAKQEGGPVWLCLGTISLHELADLSRLSGAVPQAIALHRQAFTQWRTLFATATAEDRPSVGWHWRWRPVARCLDMAKALATSPNPNQRQEARALAQEAREIFFSPDIGGQAELPTRDKQAQTNLDAFINSLPNQ